MEILLLVIVIVLLIVNNNNVTSKFKNLEDTVRALKQRIEYFQTKVGPQISSKEKPEEDQPIISKEPEIIKEVLNPKPELPKPEIEKPVIPKGEPKLVDYDEPAITIEPGKIIKPVHDTNSSLPKKDPVKKPKTSAPKKPWFETFKEKNPDLEKFIGENLINKIGILILVLGISFFVKYAIDKDWINEPARVGIGILCGALVMGIAHKLKKNYAAFSSVLVAGAISIFYFTIYIAFHEYGLFSQTVAFIIMSVITAFSALVSISYNRQELAVLTLIGGFAAPFMLSTGEGNYIVLFSYIIILNIGILAISYFKKWKIATILDFIFTVLLFGAWCLSEIWSDDFPHQNGLIFATIFYFIFSITIVLNNLRNKGVFSIIEYFILTANTFFFYGIGMMILTDSNSSYTGLFTLMLAIYNILYAGILYKKFGLDKNAVYLLIGLALTFVTLTIPIQFEGNQITIFWAIEAVLLFWLSQKSKIKHFKKGAIIVQILTLFSLLIDWKQYDTISVQYPIILNALFIPGLVVSLSLFASHWLLSKEKELNSKLLFIPLNIYKNILVVAAIVVTYFTGFLEVLYQSNQFLINIYSATSFSVTYHFIFIAILVFIASVIKKQVFQKSVLIVGIISIVLYILLFYRLPIQETIENFVLNVSSTYAFYFHYIILGCLVYFGFQLFKKTSTLFNIQPKQSKWLPWAFVFAVVYILSNEIMIHGLHFSKLVDVTELNNQFPTGEENIYSKNIFVQDAIMQTQEQIIKIGYPILWGVFSFIFLIIGIRKQWKTLRIIALSLLGITIVKLFAYDINNVSETGKIIAFILLGVLILVISFVYQKIKKLVIDDEEKTTSNHTQDEDI